MRFNGKFEWFISLHQGGKKAISFTLTCKNMLMPETFDCAIIDSSGQVPPQIRRQVKLKPNESFTFNYDTCRWDWCQGDFFAILGKNDKIEKRWDLNLKVYSRGECPDCHGTHRCVKCNGSGTIKHHESHTFSMCTACNGTGLCQTCYVPVRQGSNMANVVYDGVSMPDPHASRQRKIEALRQTIRELQAKIEQAEWDRRMMQLDGLDRSSYITYSSQLELKHQYELQLINAQHELQQLENMK